MEAGAIAPTSIACPAQLKRTWCGRALEFRPPLENARDHRPVLDAPYSRVPRICDASNFNFNWTLTIFSGGCEGPGSLPAARRRARRSSCRSATYKVVLSPMAVLILRHAQSLFNVVYDRTSTDPNLEDAALSPAGIEQAMKLRASLPDLGIRNVVVSPLTGRFRPRCMFSGRWNSRPPACPRGAVLQL